MATVEIQIRAIRTAIKGVEYERVVAQRRGDDGLTLGQFDDEIAALNDAITTIKNAQQFKKSLQEFLG